METRTFEITGLAELVRFSRLINRQTNKQIDSEPNQIDIQKAYRGR